MLFSVYSKYSQMSDIEYHPLGNSNSLFCVGAKMLNLTFLSDVFIFFHV